MTVIFGGVYQGKLGYAEKRFSVRGDDVYRCSEESTETPGGKRVIYELDKWIYAQVMAGADSDAAVRRFAEENPGAIVICNDISCGVVPAEPELRVWREAVGRALAVLCRDSTEVIRLFCGIPTRIK